MITDENEIIIENNTSQQNKYIGTYIHVPSLLESKSTIHCFCNFQISDETYVFMNIFCFTVNHF